MRNTRRLILVAAVTGAFALSACAPAAAPVTAPASTAKVTGTVTYLQRSALPPTAVIEVTLADVSKADAPAEVISMQRLEANDKQVPFVYELPYDPTRIDERYEYAVSARITDGGKLLFINTQRYPVITRGNPTSNVEIGVQPVP